MTRPISSADSDARRTGIDPAAGRTATVMLGALLIVALGAALHAMAAVATPVLFALLVTLVIAPLHGRIRDSLPDRLGWIAHVAVLLLLLTIIAVFVGALVFAAERVLATLPDVSNMLDQGLAGNVGGAAADALPTAWLGEAWRSLGDTVGGWMVDRATGLAESIAGLTGAFVTALVIVFFLVLLAMTELGVWRDKMKTLVPDHQGRLAWQEMIDTLTARLRRFLVVRTGVGLLQAALYTGWLALFGVDLLIVWAVLSFILTYIPNLGSIISGTLPVFYALLTKDLVTAAVIAAGILAIEQAVGNYIDPRILGHQIVLSPLVILVALMFWGWLLGAAGAFLATPIMLSLLVAFNHVPRLRPAALLLSNQPSQEALDAALGPS